MAARSPSSFQEQLRILQSDITNLSSKLHIPGPASPTPNGDEFLNLRDRYSNSKTIMTSPWRSGATSSPSDDAGAKKLLNRYKAELQAAVRERDDALNRLDMAHKEMEEMRRGLHQAARLRAAHDHLAQDHEAVKISLESSERIRKQQKALIDLLQRTSHMTHGSSINGDAASVQSYNSYGAQSASTTQTGNSTYTPVSYSHAVAAENKEWCGSQLSLFHLLPLSLLFSSPPRLLKLAFPPPFLFPSPFPPPQIRLNSSPARFKGKDPNWQPPNPTTIKVRRPKASSSASVASTPTRLVKTPSRKSSTTTATTTTTTATSSSRSTSRQQKASSQRMSRGSAPLSPATISSRTSSNTGRGGPDKATQRAGRPPRPTSAATHKVAHGIAAVASIR